MNKRAWVGGGVVLLAVPLAFGVLRALGDPEAELLDAVREAGGTGYAALGATLMASLAAMFFLGGSSARPALHPAALGLTALPLLASVVGLRAGLGEMHAALADVSPADRMTILFGSISESCSLVELGLVCAGALLALLSVGSLLAATPPLARLLTAATAGPLGLGAGLLAVHAQRIADLLRMSIHVSRGRGDIFERGLAELAWLSTLGLALLAAGVVLALLTALLTRANARAVGVTLVVSAVVTAGVSTVLWRTLNAEVGAAVAELKLASPAEPDDDAD